MIFQYDTTFNPENLKIFLDIFEKGEISNGDYSQKLVEKLKVITGCKHVFLTTSGTSALQIALLSLKSSSDKEILIPSYLCQDVLNAINYVGNKAKFVDINTSNYSMNIENTKKSITSETNAIIVPYMYGDLIPISELLDTKIPIIEDIAHCTGGSFEGKRVGSRGLVSITSFGDRKFLDGGFGGAVFTNNDEISKKIEKLLTPSTNEYQINYNYKIPNLICAILCEKISLLDEQIKKRKQIAKYYMQNLKKSNFRYESTDNSLFYRFMIDLPSGKNEFIEKMNSKGVVCGVGVDYPLHIMTEKNDLSFSNTLYASKHSVALPIRPNLEQNELEHVVNSVDDCL